MKQILALIVVAYGAFFPAVTTEAQNVSNSRSTKPLVALSGADSHISKPSYQRITTAEDWARIWASHLGTTIDNAYRPLLEVDFDRCQVVVIFRGEGGSVRGIQIDSVLETAQSIEVLFTELTYQTAYSYSTAGERESSKKPPDRPYAFIVVPKTNKRIVFKENRPSLKDELPNWREVATLNAIQEARQQGGKDN